jgi:hypothetical protein
LSSGESQRKFLGSIKEHRNPASGDVGRRAFSI